MNIFNDSKYTVWYNSIIESSKLRITKDSEYYEEHHIIPKSLGGSLKDPMNLVLLTGREHYIVHLLLMKMCISKNHSYKMACAFTYMSKIRNKFTKNRYNSRLYHIHKRIKSKIHSENMKGDGNPRWKAIVTDLTKKKISASRLGINTNTTQELEKKRKRWLINNPNNNPISKQKQIDALSKLYHVIDPSGKVLEVKNMAKFCKENKLSAGNMSMVANGIYDNTKGWKCSILN